MIDELVIFVGVGRRSLLGRRLHDTRFFRSNNHWVFVADTFMALVSLEISIVWVRIVIACIVGAVYILSMVRMARPVLLANAIVISNSSRSRCDSAQAWHVTTSTL